LFKYLLDRSRTWRDTLPSDFSSRPRYEAAYASRVIEALRSVLLLAQEAFVLGDASFAQQEVHSSTVFVDSSIEVGPASLKIQSKSLAHEIDQELFESPN